MLHKEKVGDVEIIYPDEDLKSMLKEVMVQNKQVLDMNEKILGSLCSPIVFKPLEE